ncbi:replication-relaxation family protein [Streptomyces sp. NPDC100445]|uniref:replication-relaxation family protein n=1 Tax=Streptomyces sp. NPDC100445 TaxID=3366102 RepID=UPI00382619F3
MFAMDRGPRRLRRRRQAGVGGEVGGGGEDTLLDLEAHHLVRTESVQEDQRQVWVLTKRGHGEAKQLLEPKGIRVSVLRKQEYDPDSGELLGPSYDDHAAAVTSTAAALHRAGITHRLGFQTEVGHRLGSGFVQRADAVVRAPAAGVPVLLLEIDRRTEDAHDLVAKLRRYREWGRLLPRDADKHTVDLVRSRPDAIGNVATGSGCGARSTRRPAGRAWCHSRSCSRPPPRRRSPTRRRAGGGRPPLLGAAPVRYLPPGITARDYGQAVPVVVTTLERRQEHGADAASWRRLGRTDEQTLTAALDNHDGDVLFCDQEARADREEERRRAAQRETERPVCKRCGQRFTDQR